MFSLVGLLSFISLASYASGTVLVSVDTSQVLNRLPESFLSVTIDTGAIEHNFHGLNFTLPRLLNLAKGLTPAVIRVGGTSEDYITYVPTGSANPEDKAKTSTGKKWSYGYDRAWSPRAGFTMNFSQWDELYKFTEVVGWKMYFGLNALKRDSSGAWDPTNAKVLIDYTKKQGYDVNWELGNEPDLFYEHNVTNVQPEQLAKDFEMLHTMLKAVDPGSILAGPDVATLTRNDYFKRFLTSAANDTPDIVTWHQYYGDGRKATLPDFYDHHVLDKLMDDMDEVRDMLNTSKKNHLPVWLGETSSFYGGGAPGLSNTFVAGFLWLDKLGLSAVYNYSHVCRQTFFGGSYSLLNSTTLEPQPDYWASLLYKQLVGPEVLSVKGQILRGRTVRVYASCTRPSSVYQAGAVTVLAMNIESSSEGVTLEFSAELRDKDVDQYLMQSGGQTVASRSVTLNGELLSLINDETLPQLTGKKMPRGTPLHLPALSYAFYVIQDADLDICRLKH